MEKRKYVKPVLSGEEFVPQNYIAACGDSGVIYKFECNAGNTWETYNVYLADGTPYATSGTDTGGCTTEFGGYSPCGGTHEADSDSGFLKGYMYKQNIFGGDTGKKIDVVIWTDNFTNCHTTAELDKNKWETAKS